MKIRKFNESKSEFDTEYLIFIFSDFVDNGSDLEVDEDNSYNYWYLYIDEPNILNSFENTIDYSNNIKSIYEFSINLESCLSRIRDIEGIECEVKIEDIVDESSNYILSKVRNGGLPIFLKRTIIVEIKKSK